MIGLIVDVYSIHPQSFSIERDPPASVFLHARARYSGAGAGRGFVNISQNL